MWSKKPIHWEDDDYHYFSFVFSWDLWDWLKSAQPELDGKKIMIGGPAVIANKDWVPNWITADIDIGNVLKLYNEEATRTTVGCIRRCSFCIVDQIEPEYKELTEWEVKPVVIDNNLLAASQKHFDIVIDRLKSLDWCDFNQGLDARLLTKHHAERFAELKNPMLRLAFDNIKTEDAFCLAYNRLRQAGIPNRNIRCYVLIGFDDTPEDAEYRLQFVKALGIKPNPMRFQDLHAKKRNDYVSFNWTHRELDRYMSYWQNLRFTGSVPFKDFVRTGGDGEASRGSPCETLPRLFL